jgi:TPP-dependent pyruvate/acetoin dehydrogenase alpha subunit
LGRTAKEHRLTNASTTAEPDAEQLLWMYRRMVTIREFEEAAGRQAEQAKIPGAVHLYAGEEAVAVGVCANLEPSDTITSTHRGHGHCIAKGGDVRRMFAELYGKADGYCRGKGGSMHIADLELGILGAVLLRRWRDERRHVARGPQLRRRLQAAGDLRGGEQPLR